MYASHSVITPESVVTCVLFYSILTLYTVVFYFLEKSMIKRVASVLDNLKW